MSPAGFIEDPNWAHFLPETTGTARPRHLPAHEDCSRIEPETAAAHLRAGGTLGSMPGYEERPGQIEMTRAIMRAFDDREHLMVEAGTGVGKSLAYLVPSVLWAWGNDTPVVLSTATRNLQSQLVSSDIPRALAVLGDDAANFKVAILKGRANYLCLRAVSDFFAAGYWTMSAEEQEEMPRFIEWLKSTPDGDLDHYEGLPRGLLSCPGEECGGRRCPYFSRCFLYRARRAAAEAHLVVVNHALVLADATSPGGGLLPASGRLVLDEAHNLEDIATDYLSREFSVPELARILNRLIRRGRRRNGRPGGILASVERQLSKGILAGTDLGDRARELVKGAVSRTVRVVSAAEDLAELAARLLAPAPKGRGIVRYRKDAAGRSYSVKGLFTPYGDDWNENDLAAAQLRFESEAGAMVKTLHDLRDLLAGSVPEGEFNFFGDAVQQLAGMAESIVAFVCDADFVLKGEKLTHAYWVERVRPEKRPAYTRLVAAPLSVADDLRKLVWEMKDSVILASATLRVGNDFRYNARRLGFGAEPRYRYLAAQSPFDYLRQSLVLAPDCLPDPGGESAKYAEGLAAMMRDLFSVTDGRALVLFTSYEMMNAVADHARDGLAADGITLYVQGEGCSRESMTETLRRERKVVLFGAQSFWEGVDVAGEALSCVVIARLPFAQIADPIVEARSERFDREGLSSFRDYYLPEAVIRFRQGFGRLIRTRRDRGVVIVTDPRIVTKGYGANFRRSIPASVHTVTSLSELLSRVNEFFSG